MPICQFSAMRSFLIAGARWARVPIPPHSTRMTRKILGSVEMVSNWTSVAGAMAGILRFLGHEMPEPELMGIYGARISVGD